MPIVIVPAMHSSMYSHDIIIENVKRLKKLGVVFVDPRQEEKKDKMAATDEIVHEVCLSLGPGDMNDKKVLVIAGSTQEPIDDVRFITNRSSGRTGTALYAEAHRRGADVELWTGAGQNVPKHMNSRRFSDVADLRKMASKVKTDIVLVPAAISDFTVKKRSGKIESEKAIEIKLTKAPKILEILGKKAKLVGFKAEVGIGRKELEKRGAARMKEHGLDLIVANLLEDVEEHRTKAILLSPGKKVVPFKGLKIELAKLIFDTLLES
jgi:phosphopantothenoylcysteine decarboxylase/phosphopantothenate--cysteine ligase